MNTMIIILGICVFLLFIWIFTGNNESTKQPTRQVDRRYPKATENPLPPQEIEGERLSLPRQFRRAQQSLARQRNVAIQNMKEMAHQGQVLDIQSQLVGVGNQQIALQDAMINLHQRDMEVTSKHNELELMAREGLLNINEARNKLETETIDSHKLRAENEINSSLLNLEATKLDLRDIEANIEYKEHDLNLKSKALDLHGLSLNLRSQEFGITEKGLELKRGQIRNELKMLEIEGIGNKLNYEDQVNQLNAKEVELKKLGLSNVKGEIQNLSKGLDLQKKDISLDIREGLHTLEHKTISNQKGELNNLLGRIDNKERSLKLSERELRVYYNEISEQYRVLLNTIRLESRSLSLDRKNNRLANKEELLQIREQKLNNLSRYIDQMYQIKNEWLKIESSGNDLQYREQKLQLDDRYFRTRREVDQLRLHRYENNLLHREQKLEIQNLYTSLQRNWGW